MATVVPYGGPFHNGYADLTAIKRAFIISVEAIRISDELVVDMTPDGTVYGIELLNANKQLWREDTGRLLVINEATGERAELLLAVA